MPTAAVSLKNAMNINFNLFLIILLFTILPNVLSYKKRFDTILKCVEKESEG